jgi:prepilin-type N-terminal cleavage/methylation domain-containing protein
MRTRHHAFSLIELMIVIAIIAVLLGIILFTLSHTSTSMKNRQTHGAMTNLVGMLVELEVATGTLRQPTTNIGTPWLLGVGQQQGPNFWTNPFLARDPTGRIVPAPLDAAEAETVGIPNTDIALRMISAVPVNRSLLQSLNSPKVDAWGHRILFVPGTGLKVRANGVDVVITGSGGRPFWASAGPDGDYVTGEDNLYSFE